MANRAKWETTVSMPELWLVASTRVLLGMGIGLLLSERFSSDQRKALGRALAAVGALSTIPLAAEIFGGGRVHQERSQEERHGIEQAA